MESASIHRVGGAVRGDEANQVKEALWRWPFGPSSQALTDAFAERANSQMRNELLRNVVGVGAGTLGVGFGLRGLYALIQQAQRAKHGPKQPIPTTVKYVPPPYATAPGEDEQQKAASLAAAWYHKNAEKTAGMWDTVKKFFQGRYANTQSGVPWAIPALAAAGTGGLIGGYRLADTMADRAYQAELDAELKKEREQFERALTVDGGGTKLAAAIDELYELTKGAIFGLPDLPDAAGVAAGLYGLYALGGGTLAGKMMYDRAKSQQRSKKIQKALRLRRSMLQQIRPTSILVSDDMPPENIEEQPEAAPVPGL